MHLVTSVGSLRIDNPGNDEGRGRLAQVYPCDLVAQENVRLPVLNMQKLLT